jgi:hypothetical protein
MVAYVRFRHNTVIRQWLNLTVWGQKPRYARKGN